MIKTLALFLLIGILFPTKINALATRPFAQLIITVNTLSGDGNFNFSVNPISPIIGPGDNPTITTANNTGTISVYIDPLTTYALSQDFQPQWQIANIKCSGGANDIINASGNDTHLTIDNYSTVTCIFTNTQAIERNPVLIIPGIMGTEIKKGSTTLWPDILRMLRTKSDKFMDPLSFSVDQVPIDDELEFTEVLGKPSKFLDYTEKLTNHLKSLGYTEDVDLFTFPYDWRRDLGYIATSEEGSDANQSLKEKIDQIIADTGAGKIDIVAHSQGGLVTKKLLLDLPDYKNKINKVIFVGVPNLGAPKAAKVLLYGDTMDVAFLGMGLDPDEVHKISQNMPAIYQLLPSREYFNHSLGYYANASRLNPKSPTLHTVTLDSSETLKFLKDSGLNSSLIDNADNFHSVNYDNMNFSPGNMKAYNLAGCQTGTPGKIMKKVDGTYQIFYVPGDGTVPIFSASNIFGAATFYALESSHGTMLTQDGLREYIISLITGTPPPVTEKVTAIKTDCRFNGLQVSIHSPVDLEFYDELGNRMGPNPDGSFDFQISGGAYDIIGHEKFAFLPAGHTYTIKLLGTGDGEFDFYSTIIENEKPISTAYYAHVPIMALSTGETQIIPSNYQPIHLDDDHNGVIDRSVYPTSITNGDALEDFTPPVTDFEINGRSIKLKATDPTLAGEESKTSGLLGIWFRIDSGEYKNYDGGITVTEPGPHVVEVQAIDNAGNREPIQTINLNIESGSSAASGGGGGGSAPFIPLVINNWATTTTSTIVSLNINSYFPNKMMLGNNSNFNQARWEPYQAFKFWTLDTIPGKKVVYLKLQDPLSTEMGPFSSTIELLPPPKPLGEVLGTLTYAPQAHPDGTLVVDSTGTVYLIQNRIKRAFTSAPRFRKLKYKFKNIQPMWDGDELLHIGRFM